MIRWKVDVLAKLKDAGYSSYRIRQQNLLGQQTLTALRRGELPATWALIDKLCGWIDCQPGDLLEFVRDEENTPDA